MAEYGINATQLSAPQGAGATPVAPVRVDGAIPKVLSWAGNIFAKGLENHAKEMAEERKNTIVGEYVKQEAMFNDAVMSGQMKPDVAASRSRYNFNSFAASHPEYIEDFKKAADALRGHTEKGETERKLDDERKVRQAEIEQASRQGFIFLPGMDKSAENDQIRASKTAIIAQQELEVMYKHNTELRAQGTYDAQVAERELKQTSFQLVNKIASENITAFASFGTTLGQQVRSGKLTSEAAQATLAERFANISAGLQSTAQTNPELAGPFRTLFNDLNEVNKKLIDPKNQAEDLENQLNIIKTRMKLLAFSKPRLAATIIANELLPNNPGLALSSAPEAIDAISFLSGNALTTNQYAPQVAGNPEVEEDVLKMLKGGLNSLKGGNIPNKDVAEVQAANTVNHLLAQTGRLLDQGVTPDRLKNLAAFFASPEYASMVANNKISKEAAGAAYKTFQLMYEPTIIRGVQQKLENVPAGQSAPGTKKPDVPKIGDTVLIEFSGSGIVFKEKPYKKFDIVEARQRQEQINSMKIAQTAINQLIHIGAHMEGTTDYQKYWDEKKSVWFPTMFPAEEGKKPTPKVESAPVSRNKAEEAMAKAVVLTPEEQARGDVYDLTDANLNELRQEIDRATNPTIKGILEAELNKLLQKKAGR